MHKSHLTARHTYLWPGIRMRLRIDRLLKCLSVAQRFMLASFFILLLGMLGIGWWIGQEIATGVIHRTAATTALYMDSFVAPNLQELAQRDSLTPDHVTSLSRLLQDTPLGQQIAAFKVWDAHGRILYSTAPASIGQIFPVQGGLARAWSGEVAARISDLQDEENALERDHQTRLLEIYSPVRLRGTDQIIAVAEFYQTVDDLQREISAAQIWSWLVLGIATLVMYVLLAGFIQRASDTIASQQAALSSQVSRLTDLLKQNAELHERVRRAAARTTALNERFLRRISAELHDGPAQDISLALLRLDHVMARCEGYRVAGSNGQQDCEDVEAIESSLNHALQEVRAISCGLGLPQLGDLTLAETIARVIRAHERRAGTRVTLNLDGLPEQASLPVKITLYRVIQEALNNAYRHAGGINQQVRARCEAYDLIVEVVDQGSGFDGAQVAGSDEHLGLIGMRERVESLGGLFRIESEPGYGTKVIVCLSLQAVEGSYER
jgi:signal transduction histidine kinase